MQPRRPLPANKPRSTPDHHSKPIVDEHDHPNPVQTEQEDAPSEDNHSHEREHEPG